MMGRRVEANCLSAGCSERCPQEAKVDLLAREHFET